MSDKISDVGVPVAMSTVQAEDEFGFQKFDSDTHDREFYLGKHTEAELLDRISEFYALDKLVSYFQEHNDLRSVTLQFPDALIKDSSLVSKILQKRMPEFVVGLDKEENSSNQKRFWILADTAYSSCCVDEVAAEHVSADSVVHFGDACLNAIQKLPVVYSLGRPVLCLSRVIEQFKATFNDLEDKICIMADASYSYHMRTLYDALTEEGYSNIIYGAVNDDMLPKNAIILGDENTSKFHSDAKELYTLGNRKLYTKNTNLTLEDGEDLQRNFKLFHVTVPQDPHLLYLTTVFNSVFVYDNKDNSISSGPFPSLMKRYKYMHVGRTAGCIGILVNTLSLRNTKETINKLIKLIKDNGKKHYLFVVGKPNVAKLANFEPIDIWCILGCGQSGIIVDQYNEFYKPIITPYELTMALNSEVTWTGKWIVDFQNALRDVEDENEELEEEVESTAYESDAPEFDVVTGKYVSTSRPLRGLTHLELESPQVGSNGELIHRVAGGAVIKGTVSTSVSHLESRAWKGLGSDFIADENYNSDGADVEEGITGVARGYQFDRNDAVDKSNP